MAVFAATVLGGVFIILDLEGSKTAPGPTGDTLEVVKPSLRASSLCSQITCCGECGNPSSHPLHFWCSGETRERHLIQNKSKTLKFGEGAENGLYRQSWEFWCKDFREKRSPGGAHPQYCLYETAFSEAEPSPPETEAPLLYCCVTFRNDLTSLSFPSRVVSGIMR